MLCDYGCGKEAKFWFKNGKGCCSESKNSCPELRRVSSERNKGKRPSDLCLKMSRESRKGGGPTKGSFKKGLVPWNKDKKTGLVPWNKDKKTGPLSIEHKQNLSKASRRLKIVATPIQTNEFCSFGCGQKAKFQYKNGKFCCNDTYAKCPVIISKTLAKGTEISKTIEYREIKRELMKINGNRIRKQIKNPSEPELNLREIVKELYSSSEHTHKVLEDKNYEVDNAIIENKIAIEYDGYHHFKDQESLDYHNKRQEEIEQEGWRFIRYSYFKPFPTKNQVKEDIRKVLEEKQ